MDSEARPAEASGDADRHIGCSMSSVLLKLVRAQGGEEAVSAVLREAGANYDAAYLEDLDNWISQDEANALQAAGVHVTGDPAFARRVGEEMVGQHAGKQVATLLRSLGSVEGVLTAVAQTTAKLSAATELEAVEVGPGHALVKAAARSGFTRNALNCDWTTGLLASCPMLFGLPPARIEERECQARGGARCLYTVTWDAHEAATAADPQQRVTALEGQLLATSERLQGVYAIASDLVSTEDVETVLQRIVDRASDAVRAPSHVLAVRPDPDAELQVYGHGIGEREAQALAHKTLAQAQSADAPASASSTLVVDVVSSRRAYGQLIASYPHPVDFLPQEREMLSLYAKHAAAVLEMALALRESAQRHEQVSALLALSHALAKAGTSLEVAERLVAAVPDVVDCDRMTVWIWNGHEQCLRTLASWTRVPERTNPLDDLSIAPENTPHLQSMLTEPRPHFFDATSDDPFITRLMSKLEVVAMTVVPIVVRDVFLGILAVSVTEAAERLRPDSDLLQRLTGVAALAAPAIQNGQLVDQLRHKASHDGLTGLLNRVGFRQQIDAALARVGADEGRIGLLFVDLNEFKRINDLHGHEAGDELIRQAGARLSSLCRGDDDVARLGGDEFAIILADVHLDEQVRAAERRVRAAFTAPFDVGGLSVSVGASVGGGIWPDDGQTVSELVRHADAAMYEDKAHSRRGSRTAHLAPAR
ncbi:MAG TPA: diguanylate cyclase [Solirubrobacteraceae bacterium]|nr:diguanylate cyclase [Solirubrobacteraceae bacterium]